MVRPKARARAKASARPETRRPNDVEAARETYLAAWRWRRAVEKELRALGLTFTQWLVLEGTNSATALGDAPVNQSDVARSTELDRMTISQVMKTLAERGLVDRTPDVSGPAYRIMVTDRGRKALKSAAARVAAATRAHG